MGSLRRFGSTKHLLEPVPGKTMKIGIVSAQKHCKTHLRQLASDGHEVYCLGAKPKQIPPSYDVLIVRIASMRHCDSYKEWAKTTGRPVIYEDGLSGARRELAKIQSQATTPQLATATISVQDVLDQMVEWGSVLLDARPLSNNRDISRHLSTLLREQFPSMASNSKALVASVVARLSNPSTGGAVLTEAPPEPYTTPYTATVTESEAQEPPVIEPTQNTPYPAGLEGWCKVYTQSKLKVAYKQAVEGLDLMEKGKQGLPSRDDLCREFKKAEKGRRMTNTVAKKMVSLVKGKPLAYVMLVYLAMPEDHLFVKQAFCATYKQITGKGSDTRLWRAVEWYLGRTEPVHEPTIITPPAAKTEPQGIQPGKVLPPLPPGFLVLRPGTASQPFPPPPTVGDPGSRPAVEARVLSDSDRNTEDILGIIEDFADFKNQFQKWKGHMISQADTTEQNLEEAIKAGLDPRTNAKLAQMEKRIGDLFATQLKNFKHEINRTLEPRVKALEDSSGLALDAERQPSGDLSSNPFDALEQVKAALKAAGFKGTLTLTIE